MPTSSSPTKLIVLTGVSRGLGRALAEKFVALGHTVLGCARSATAMNELAHQFRAPSEFYPVNVASDDEVKSWASLVTTKHGAPDLLINNAGLINRPAPLWDVPAQEFDEVVDVNVKGVANVIRHFVPAMLARKRGVIVNLSSGWGRSTDAEVAPYCATKWAIEGLTQSLAQELPSGLAAVALNPGIINTDMLRSCWGGSAKNYPSPEQWAERAASFILGLGPEHSGQPLTVPGAAS
ncbi:MAG: SDR family oxidoreductase [Verrucomicrobia bacterium]|nr:SDR family oxidoreductase [Verrucomicrobiota bacterium]